MHVANWIALAACVAAFLALVPSFSPMLKEHKSRQKKNEAQATPPSKPDVSDEPVRLNAFGKALALTSMALVIGVIEIVLFSAVAELFGVAIDVKTMPTNWLVVFYGLFLLPGVCLFWAAAHLFNLFE